MAQRYFRHLLLFFFFFAHAISSYAHTGSIKGSIKSSDGKALEGVSIYFKELKISAVTDAFGGFFLRDIEEGKYTLSLSYVGYATLIEEIKVEEGITTGISFTLQPAGVGLEEVTINAKKEKIHGSLSEFDIRLKPINSAQDMLRMVPGLFIAQHQGGGKAEQIFLRGFDVDHGTDVNVSVDGMPVNMVSHAHGQGYADLHFVIPELVDKLNFGKGPYDIDKGNFTTAGWVDFKTKDRLGNSFVKHEGGSFGFFRSVAALNLLDKEVSKNQSAYVAGEYLYNRSYFDAPQDFNRINVMGKYTNAISSSKLMSITLSGFRSNWNASGQIPQRAIDQDIIGRFGKIDDEFGKTSRYNMNVAYTQAVGHSGTFKANVFASYYDFELFSNFTFFLKDSVNGDQIKQKEQRALAGYNADYTTSYKIGRIKTSTQVGTGLRFDNSMDNELSHTLKQNTLLERYALGDIYETNIFGYVNQVVYITPRAGINAGTRFDQFVHSYKDKLIKESEPASTANVAAFSPKAGAFYNFKNSGRVYFNYGKGFHSNDTRVVVAQQGKDVLPMANSYDLGIIFKPFRKLLVSAAAWQLNMQQEFVYVGDEAVVELSGKTQRKGIDLSMRYQIFKWLYADADVNYTHARAIEEPKGADYIPLAPAFTSIGGLTASFTNGISASLRYRYMGDRAANEDNSVIAKGYNVFDAALNYSRRNYEFGTQIQNLFNTTWNEAQFDTETRLRNEAVPVSEICFTPGMPFFIKLYAAYKF